MENFQCTFRPLQAKSGGIQYDLSSQVLSALLTIVYFSFRDKINHMYMIATGMYNVYVESDLVNSKANFKSSSFIRDCICTSVQEMINRNGKQKVV